MPLRLILSWIGIIAASWVLPVQAAGIPVQGAAVRAQAKLPLGQLLMVGFAGAELDKQHPIFKDIKQRHLGGVVLFNYGPDRNHPAGNISSAHQLRRLTAQLQQAAGNTPLLIAIDQEGGRINRLKPAYGFPPSVSFASLGRRNNLALTRRQARTTARTLQQAGINLNLSPVVDLNVNPDNPIIGRLQRSFSAEPDIVIAHAREVIRAHHQQGVLCCLKHFPGHGSSTADSHKGFVDVTDTWSRRELLPFAALIDEGLADAVLTAHVFNRELDPRYPATLSQKTVGGVLRKQLGFQGVVISDDLTMGAIADQYRLADAVEKALNAGVDILLLADNSPDTTSRMLTIMQQLIDSGRITRERIVQSLQRIDTLKAHLRSNVQRQP